MKRLAFVAALATAISAHAGDGIIEINHAKVTAAGGYPYTISQPGSYRLTSNLQQPAANTNVIVVAADGVTIDLNGFAIRGSNNCTLVWSPHSVTCAATGTGYGIGTSAARTDIAVRNGTVSGVGGRCLEFSLATSVRIEDVSVSHCGADGINMGEGTALRIAASYSGATGIVVAGTLSDCYASFNGQAGIYGTGTIKNCTVRANALGMAVTQATVIDSRMANNEGAGLQVDLTSAYRGNVIVMNGATTTTIGTGTLINGGSNVCGLVSCP